MSEYGILRVAKLKQVGNVGGSLGHITREIVPPNADPERLAENTLEGGETTSELMKAFRERLPNKVRKNAVHALEVVVTASPEKMAEMSRQEQDAFFEDSKKFIGDHFGGAKNIFASAIHRDEKTPHMHVLLVPINEQGKLSANTYMKNRETLRKLQDDFGDKVIKSHGLKRGIRGSRTKHISPQKWAGMQEAKEKELREKQKYHHQEVEGGWAKKLAARTNNVFYGKTETDEQHWERVIETALVKDAENRNLAQNNKNMVDSVQRANEFLEANRELLKLPKEELEEVRQKAKEKNKAREKAKAQERANKRAKSKPSKGIGR